MRDRGKSRVVRVLALMLTLVLVVSSVTSSGVVYAEDTKESVVLGGDLTEKQEKKVIKIMGTNTKHIKRISHKREVAELKKWLTMRYIGDIAVSSTYVKTIKNDSSKNKLQLKTVNINYVTNDMYYNIMTTLGMQNVSVTIAAPEPVFGSCAILGLIDGYENVSGKKISKSRKTLAFREMRLTVDLSKKYGRKKVKTFWRRMKMRAINSHLTEYNNCKAIVKVMASLSDLNLTSSEITEVTKIMVQMADKLDEDDLNTELEGYSISNKEFGKVIKGMVKTFKEDTRERFVD